MKKNIAFLYEGPHKINREWAESLNARFIPNFGAGPKKGNPFWKRGLRAFFSLFLIFKIPREIDVLLIEEGLGIIPAYLFKKTRKKKKVVLILSGPLSFYLKDKKSVFYLMRRLIWKMVDSFDGVIVKSSMTYDLAEVRRKRVVHSHIEVPVINGFNRKEGKNILSIGVVGKLKGMDKMLEVFKEVKKEFPKMKYYVLGEGKLPGNIEGLEKVGFTSDPEEYFKKSAILLHLSRADAFPLAVLEAMGSGVVPIISENVGTKDILEKLDPSLIVRDQKEAIEKVKDLLKDKRKLNRLSKLCRQEASKLTKEKQIKKFQDTFWSFVE